jgi:hypothetical protein
MFQPRLGHPSSLYKQAMKAQMGSRGIALLFFKKVSAGGGGNQRHAPAALPLGKKPGTHCTGG